MALHSKLLVLEINWGKWLVGTIQWPLDIGGDTSPPSMPNIRPRRTHWTQIKQQCFLTQDQASVCCCTAAQLSTTNEIHLYASKVPFNLFQVWKSPFHLKLKQNHTDYLKEDFWTYGGMSSFWTDFLEQISDLKKNQYSAECIILAPPFWMPLSNYVTKNYSLRKVEFGGETKVIPPSIA